jgi:UDPglucose--hexose-1-phosphate uridylyltransferase
MIPQFNQPADPPAKIPGHQVAAKFDSTASEIRRHYYLNRYVVIAPKRHLRPDSFGKDQDSHKTETVSSPALELEPATYQIASADGNWQVKVVANGFPALSLDNPNAYGRQEIIIETPQHNLEFSELTVEQITRIFDVYVNRLDALSKIPGIQYVSVFKNDGPKAGASIAHAHSQVVAWPLIPPDLEAEADIVDQYRTIHDTCPHCDIITWELSQSDRIITQDEFMVAISPYATRVPFGAWILPRRHCSNLSELNPSERQSLAAILKNLTSCLDESKISFNFFLQNSLPGREQHFVLRLEPRLSIWAGGEFSTGIVINMVPPEFASLWYQKKIID